MFAIPRPEGEVSDEAAGLENSVVDLRSYKLTSLVMSLFSLVRKSVKRGGSFSMGSVLSLMSQGLWIMDYKNLLSAYSLCQQQTRCPPNLLSLGNKVL